MERCSVSIIVRKKKIITMRYYLTFIRMSIFFLKGTVNVVKGVKQNVGGNLKWGSLHGKLCGVSSKT